MRHGRGEVCNCRFNTRFHRLRFGPKLHVKGNWPAQCRFAEMEERHGIWLAARLHNNYLQTINSADDLRQLRRDRLQLVELRMDCGRFLKSELRRGALALLAEFAGERLACGVEECLHTHDFSMIVSISASLEAGSQAHLHFGINASRKGRVRMQVFGAAAHFEEVERVASKFLGGSARREGAVIKIR